MLDAEKGLHAPILRLARLSCAAAVSWAPGFIGAPAVPMPK